MQGLKAPANSCMTSPTRKLSVELDQSELRQAFTAVFMTLYGEDEGGFSAANALWPAFWVAIKSQPSFTTRVNGRVLIKRQRIISKKTRAMVAALRRKRATQPVA